MITRDNTRVKSVWSNAPARLIVVLAITCAIHSQALAQQTPADTQIKNTASATYSDGSQSYATTSNTVTVIVSKVSGLTITPDVTNGSSDPTVVPGQNGVRFNFTVTNTGNFTDNVRFKAAGASVSVAGGMATVASAFIDMNGNNTYQAGTDFDIKGNAADVVSPNVAQNASLSVVVFVNVNGAAPAGSIINVRLGDADDAAPYDNEPIDSSAGEVRTESAASVNGRREARGDRSATVDNDAQLALSLTSPTGTGPVALGSNITYTWQLCNTGARSAAAITLANVSGAPVGGDTGVWIFAPVPQGTTLAAQSFPAGTLYSNSAVGTDPVSAAQWFAVPTGTVTRIAFKAGNTLAPGAGSCSANFSQIVTITTPDATNSITEQGTASANNSITSRINATSAVWTITLQMVGSVLNGPQGAPGAVNNTNNDDFTNKSVNTGIAGIAPGNGTDAVGVVTFTNTVQNTGNANDTFTLTVGSYPAGSTVKVTVNAVQTTVVNNGTATGNAITPMSIAYGGTANYQVEVTLPIGTTVLSGYDTVVRATSSNTNTQWNETIDRTYTGFIRLVKTATVSNGTGVGGATDPVPGAVIIYAIAYDNVSSAQAGSGSGCVTLTASNIVISEDGSAGTNNWGATTTMVLGPPAGLDPSDSNGGTIIDGSTTGAVTAVTNYLKDTVASLGPQQSGVFTFRRQIK
ncbi:MAG TPA: hypothetical protein VM095_15520 [Pyrinomonadaceae bacterium]|nr:hypothetical protein [Pyrinomonadaceae bacterium]